MGLFDIFGADGANFKATGVPINPVDVTSAGLGDVNLQQGNQAAFLSALQAQGGIGNQMAVFNQQRDLMGQQQGVLGQQQGLLGQQQGLAGQLGMQARGQGPNPALAQLAMTTGQNQQQQAAMMASQRGAGSNPALLSKMAAEQGGALQQQAGGQAAMMRAQQQLAAQQALGQQQMAMGNTLGQVGGQQMNMGQIGSNMAGIAGQQVGQQQSALNSANQNALNKYNINLNAQQGNTAQKVAMQSNMNNANAGIAQQNSAGQSNIIGGLIGAAGSGAAMLSQGGVAGQKHESPLVRHCLGLGYAEGGEIQPMATGNNALMNVDLFNRGAIGLNPIGIQKMDKGKKGKITEMDPMEAEMTDNKADQSLGRMGMSPSPMAGPISPLSVWSDTTDPYLGRSQGGKVGGEAQVPGDSPTNDTVPAKLSPGEIVIPRTAVGDPHKIAAFLNNLLGIHLTVGGK